MHLLILPPLDRMKQSSIEIPVRYPADFARNSTGICQQYRRFIIATRDPHPLGSGGQIRLREAGIQTELGLMKAEADALYADFFASVT